MKAIRRTPPALAAAIVKTEWPSAMRGQRERTAAATTRTIALMNIVSRISAISRSPRRAVIGPTEDTAAAARPANVFGRPDLGERSTRSDDGSDFPQTKHSTLSSSFFTPHAGQYIRHSLSKGWIL